MNLEKIKQLGNNTEVAKLLGVSTMTWLNWRGRLCPATKMQENYVKLINHLITTDKETLIKLLDENI
jgi:hypothetical protein